ncbi:hypothetical protein N656DRAFT_771271 [Canariomyces notabilis]|uniref:SnoaL-like domain-containing protein n=1 Tax=Canariomyces notabilis TaxID=2074819 RepID=A0AAN6QF92_9PEZI|nr:hypothetical protein N656DRAFT_771271 [Canariomyces arenarius]
MAANPEAAEIIRRKKAQYCRFLDTKQWDALEQLALPDAEFRFLNPDGSVITIGKTPLDFSTPKAFTAFMAVLFDKARTLHMVGGSGEIEPRDSPDEMSAVWGMEDQIVIRGTAGLAEMRGGGYYHEIWKRDGNGGDWHLKSLRLERIYAKSSVLGRVFAFLLSIWLMLS